MVCQEHNILDTYPDMLNIIHHGNLMLLSSARASATTGQKVSSKPWEGVNGVAPSESREKEKK